MAQYLTETVVIEALLENESNPRAALEPGDPAFEQLREAVEAFDVVRPPVLNRRTDRLVSGHQLVRVLRHLGHKTVEVWTVDEDEERERALMIALNRVRGDWDVPKLEAVLGELGSDMAALAGFADGDLARLMGDSGAEAEGDSQGAGGEGGAADEGDAERPEPVVPEGYRVTVRCGSEDEQLSLAAELREAGLEVRASTHG